MKHHIIKIIINYIFFILFNQYAISETQDILYKNQKKPSINNQKTNTQNTKTTSILIKSSKIKTDTNNSFIKFYPPITIEQNNKIITTNSIVIYQKQNNSISITQTINYIDDYLSLIGKSAYININKNYIDIYQSKYLMLKQQIHGQAKLIKQKKNQYTILKYSNLTSCSPKNNCFWNLTSNEIIFNHKNQTIDIWHPIFKINHIPILYIPYLQLSTNNSPISGLSYPTIQYSSLNNLMFNIPYHFYGKKYKAIIIPNYIYKKGIQMKYKLQYLNKFGAGIIQLNSLNDKYKKNQKYYNNWKLYWEHKNKINNTSNIHINYYMVTNKLPSKTYYKQKNNQYMKQIYLMYNRKNIDIILSNKQSTLFKYKKNNNYIIYPQLNININNKKTKLFHYQLINQITYFANINKKYPNTIRLHTTPIINLPLIKWGGVINTELKLYTTHYKKTNYHNYIDNKQLKYYKRPSIIRIIPQFKSEYTTIIKNYNHHYKYIIKPKIQYLFIPYNNQKKINIFDSEKLPINTSILFQDMIYSGLDRIASMNKLTNAITMYIYNKKQKEIFNISAGQIYHFTMPKTGDEINNFHQKKININPIWVIDTNININEKYNMYYIVQYNIADHYNKIINKIGLYYKNNNKIIQLNWHYFNTKYATDFIFYNDKINLITKMSQINIISKQSIINNLTLNIKCNYNIKKNKITNYLTNLEYKNNCLKMKIEYEHKIIRFSTLHKYDNKISCNFALITIPPINTNN